MQEPIVTDAYTMPVQMQLSSHEQQLLSEHRSKVERWGWRWQQSALDTSALLLTAPGCILDTCMGAMDLQVKPSVLAMIGTTLQQQSGITAWHILMLPQLTVI